MKAYVIDQTNLKKAEEELQEILNHSSELVSLAQSESYHSDSELTHVTITVVIKEQKQ